MYCFALPFSSFISVTAIDRIIPTENEHYIIYLTNYNGQLMLAPADPIVAGTGGEWTLTVVNRGVSSTQTMRLAHVGSLNLITYMERASNLFSTQLQRFVRCCTSKDTNT